VSAGAFEIDIAEVHYPNDLHMTLHNWVTSARTAVGFDSKLSGDFSKGFHDFGVLWTSTDIIFEVDGEPVAAIATHGAITKPVDIRFSTALADFAGKIPDNPAGHHMSVRSLRVYPL
jgi:beta-glucanase (GH16 family)